MTRYIIKHPINFGSIPPTAELIGAIAKLIIFDLFAKASKKA